MLRYLNKGPLVLLFQSGTSFPPKVQDNDFDTSCSCALIYKGPGGIKVVINLISTDIILVDLTLLLTPNTFADGINWKAFRGKHFFKVLRWGFGPNSNKRWWDFTMEKCTRTNQEASVFWYISSSGTKGRVLGTGRQNHEQNRDQQELSSSSRLAPGNMLPTDLLQNKFKSSPCVYTSPHTWCSCP